MLIKKTIVLQSDGATVGYVTLVRVGSEVGVKTVLNVVPPECLIMGIKTTSGQLYIHRLDGARTEFKPDISLLPTDEVGIVILDADGRRFASGGRRETVNVKLLAKALDEEGCAKNESDGTADIVRDVKIEPTLGDDTSEAEETEPEVTATSSDAPSVTDDVTVTPDDDTAEASRDDMRGADKTVSETEGLEEPHAGTSTENTPFYMNKGENFYKNVRARLNDIMTENPREEALERLIPESKWVRVYYDTDEYYVVGILTEEGEVTFLAYGVPGVEGIRPPKEAEELCDFLELPGTSGEGYWIMFQNAKNGEIAKSI